MLKQLDKGVSTPIAITIIIVLVILIGGGVLGYQYYWLPKQEAKALETETPTSTPTETPKMEKISIKITYRKTTFNVGEKSFETEDFITKKKFLVITDDSTRFYKKVSVVDYNYEIIEDGYTGFSDFANTMQNCEPVSCPLVPTVEGILQDANTIKATDVYSFVQ